MIKKGNEIYMMNTLGMDSEEQKKLPTQNDLSDLQRKAGGIIRRYAFTYLSGEDALKIYGDLATIGKQMKELEVRQVVEERRSILLEKLRGACKTLKEYADTFQVTAKDARPLEWLEWKMVEKDYKGHTDWYGVPDSDESYLAMLREWSRIKKGLSMMIPHKQNPEFESLGQILINNIANKYL